MPYGYRKFPQNKMGYANDHAMWLRLAAVASLLAVGGFMLTGCGDSDDDEISPAAGPVEGGMGGVTMGVDASGTYIPNDPSMTMLLPTAASGYPVTDGANENGVPAVPSAYRGAWASDAESCALPDGTWHFEELATRTPKGVTCEVNALANPAGSVSTTLQLTCKGEGMTAQEEWELSSPTEGRMNLIRKFGPTKEDIDGGGTIPLVQCQSMAERGLHGVYFDRG